MPPPVSRQSFEALLARPPHREAPRARLGRRTPHRGGGGERGAAAGGARAPGRGGRARRPAPPRGARHRRAALDTGAWRSYLVAREAGDLPRCGTSQDFNPILGKLEHALVRAQVRFAGVERTLELGVAPPELEGHILATGCGVLLGTDVMTGVERLRIRVPG